ncbi:hypothetical protein GCM10027515_05080 [Schumannella luteola]|uniref:Uncharacterized protein n=1 Tax=Schumannella luteola TaxID=472059 RepID=A0A852YM99_9MICO|nr:hypothetical protein [Schumannella luteola]NYG98355.1 hypothetical protein [Schumannella luteola]TPX05776.1 hypothetical protein FJ656_04955 [Schumannella luteola]
MSESFRPAAPRALRRLAALLGATAVGAALALAPATAASAAPRVTVTGANGQAATADPDYATSVTVKGSGFQTIQGGFGGIYVLFGWVDDPKGGTWKPSKGGVVGEDFRYVPDSEAKDNAGFQRFVSFPGSDTESAAQAIMQSDGSWSVGMTLPSAVFESHDRANKVIEVDCRKVTCGVLTIGAHGVKNANNESFTPVSFVAPGASGTGAGASGAAGAGAAAEGADAAAAGPAEPARVGLQSSTVAAGDALVFTAQGFTAGEQVVAVLDDGVAAVGPLTAGATGEVAGVLSIPRTIRAGTHALTLTGAGSGQTADVELKVTAASGAAGGADAAGALTASSAAEPMWPYLVLGAAILVALVLLTLSVVTTIRRARRARRAQAEERAAAEAVAPAGIANPAAAPGEDLASAAPVGDAASGVPAAPADDPIALLLSPADPEAPTERLEVRR